MEVIFTAKLGSFRRIIAEDYDEKDRKTVEKLGYSINVFADDVLASLNKGLTIEDNLAQAKKDITVTVDSTGVPTTSTVVLSGLNNTVVGMQVIRAINNTNTTLTPTSTPFITFSDNSGQITISKVSGLQANNRYTLRTILYT